MDVDTGLSIDMLDVDRLRVIASTLQPPNQPAAAQWLDGLADSIEKAVRDIGELRAALDQVRQQLAEQPTLPDLATSLGLHYLSADRAFDFFREREFMLRRVQEELETHKSNAPTALDALLDRIAHLRARAEAAEAKAAEAEATIRALTQDDPVIARKLEQDAALRTKLEEIIDPKRPVPPTVGNDDYRQIHVQGYRHAMKDIAALLASPSAGTQEGR